MIYTLYNRWHAVLYAALIFIILCPAGVIGAADESFPFHEGERLTFQLRWAFIPVGKAVMEVLPREIINGVEAYHFVLTAKSYPIIDPFYKVRDRIDAYADVAMTHSLLYKKKQLEGDIERDEIVRFDWEHGEAQYCNFGKALAPISILPGTFDPLSVYYYVRRLAIKKKLLIKQPVTDGKKNITGKAVIVKRETLKLKSGTYDTYLMEPSVEQIGGVFEKSKKARIRLWITADNRRMLVKIKSKVRVGSFVGELVSIDSND